jgi:hypothetical protein
LSVGTLRLFSEIRKVYLLGEERLEIPGKWRLPIRYSSITAAMFRDRIRSTQYIMVISKL